MTDPCERLHQDVLLSVHRQLSWKREIELSLHMLRCRQCRELRQRYAKASETYVRVLGSSRRFGPSRAMLTGAILLFAVSGAALATSAWMTLRQPASCPYESSSTSSQTTRAIGVQDCEKCHSQTAPPAKIKLPGLQRLTR